QTCCLLKTWMPIRLTRKKLLMWNSMLSQKIWKVGSTEETMVEVSDSLILEVLDRFDRIETLLQRIAEGLATSSGNP
ncbi:MAG: hypothetical protein TQ37_04080, partial [Candidatus Synechococcus spongiarum 15L]